MGDTVRVGFIGAGGILGHHVEALRQIPQAELVGLWDVDPENLRAQSERFDIPAAAGRDALLEAADAVFVIAPTFAHREHVAAAAEAGKHVFCEKPIALGLEDADAMIAVTERAGVRFMVGFNNRFDEPTRTMGEMFRAGSLGRLVACWDRHFDFRKAAFWTAKRGRPDEWRLDMERSGGRIAEFGSHKVDWMIWLGGDVRSITGRADTIAETLQGVDDTDLALLDFEQGYGRVEISLSPTAQSARQVGILGTEGSVEFDGTQVAMRRRDSDEIEVVTPPQSGPLKHRHFIDCVLDQTQPLVDGPEARKTLEVCLAFQRSAETGECVRLPL